MSISEVHGQLATTALLYFLVISLWGYFRFFRKLGIDSAYWGALAIAEILIIAQVVLGIYMWVIGLRPPRTIHLLYGTLVPAMIPGAYFYTKGREDRPEILVYSTVTIITVGLIIRGISTGLDPIF